MSRRLRRRRAALATAALATTASLLVSLPSAEAAPTYAASVAADSPLSYWRLGEAPGTTTAADASGHGYAGTYSASVTRGAAGAIVGDANTAAAFDGSSGQVTVPDAAGLRLNGSFTIELWGRMTSFANSWPGLLVKGSAGTSDGYLLWYTADGTVHFKRNGNDFTTKAGALTTGGFSHLVVTYNGSTVSWYVNGVLHRSASVTYPANGGTAPLRLGMGDQYGAHVVDEVAMYSTALSATRIQSHYTEGRSTGSGPSPTTSPSASPSTSPTPSPTVSPTVSPSASPTLSPTTSPTPAPSSTGGGTAPVIAAVGDIACDPTDANYRGGAGSKSYCHQRAVANLVAAGGYKALFSLGDQQYADATLAKFQQSYATDWGRFNPITYPVPGNHEYLTSGASGYYQYFGSRAGSPSKGYYSFDLGGWHIVALNGECSYVGGCGAGSPQEQFLKADLAAHPASCTLAMWHEPRFSSGEYGDHGTTYTAFWNDLYAAGADVILNSHIHNYERFAPMDPAGAASATRGIREFVVGTGGKSLVGFSSPLPNSQAQNSKVYGILALTLKPTSYDWRFVGEGGRYTDSGSTSCH
jgi:acid phosphatase type 7